MHALHIFKKESIVKMGNSQKFFRGSVSFLNPAELLNKAASRVSSAMPLSEAMDELGLSEDEIKSRYSTFSIDGKRYVQGVIS